MVSGSSGSSSGTGYSLMPRKEPYRAPTDPNLMSSFLAAAREGSSCWQERLPPLYIHSATGHPLSLHHSAQQRPIWGPSLRVSGEKRTGGVAGLGSLGGYDPKHRCYYGLHKGAMGQQQLLLGPAAAAAAGPGGEQTGSASGSFGYTVGSSSEDVESEAADNSAALVDEEVSSSGERVQEMALGDDAAVVNSGGKRRKQEQRQQDDAPGAADSYVVPSVGTEAGFGAASEQQVVPSTSPRAMDVLEGAARLKGWRQQQRYGRHMAAAHRQEVILEGDECDEDEGSDSFGAYPAVSATTACSGVEAPRAVEQVLNAREAVAAKTAPAAADDSVDQQVDQKCQARESLLLAEAARLQELELQAQ